MAVAPVAAVNRKKRKKSPKPAYGVALLKRSINTSGSMGEA